MAQAQKLAMASAKPMHDVRFPGETAEYRAARDALLREEIELRRHTEAVAAQRRALPLGGEIKEDYRFNQDAATSVKMSELFGDKSTLVTYNFMFGPQRQLPCSSCCALLDGLDGSSKHFTQHVAFVVIAKSPIERILAAAQERGWRNLRFASSAGTSFNRDYGGEDAEVGEWPALNVFTRRNGRIYHFYASEMLFTKPDPGQDMRHNGPIDQFWNMLDFTPEGRQGRGARWQPQLHY
jgi:predicted dithiol-disulfide oxidoreductase (DUF899 family)